MAFVGVWGLLSKETLIYFPLTLAWLYLLSRVLWIRARAGRILLDRGPFDLPLRMFHLVVGLFVLIVVTLKAVRHAPLIECVAFGAMGIFLVVQAARPIQLTDPGTDTDHIDRWILFPTFYILWYHFGVYGKD